jgi:hypothetical protein
MKIAIISAIMLIGLTVSCTDTPRDQTPATVLGLVEFTLEDNGTQIQATSNWLDPSLHLAAPTLTANNLPTITSAGTSSTNDFNGRRYLAATFNIQNPTSGRSYNNLTFHAISVDNTIAGGSSLGGTSLRNLKTSTGTAITAADVARGVKPSHKLVNLSGVMQVDASGADFQVFHPTADVQPVQNALNAIPALNNHVNALGYGFVARRAANNPARAINAGQSGVVTLGLHFPISTSNSPRTLSLTYVVVNETITRVTEAPEEQGTNSGAIARAAALGANVGVNVLPGSSLSGGNTSMVCPVTWAVSSNAQAALTTACASPPSGHAGHRVYVNPALIPAPTPADDVHLTDRVGPSPHPVQPPGGDTPGAIGAFRISCTYSHMAFDDPIVYPGQSGRSHLHLFFGNHGINGNSTPDSIANTGGTTCLGGTANRSGYWIPSMIDTREGRPMPPGEVVFVYYKTGYKGVRGEDVRPVPTGLRMITGDAGATTAPPRFQERFEFWCTDANHTNAYGNGQSIPTCRPGDRLNTTIAFPQCWDGVNLDSADHKSHMAFAENGCPPSHPVPFVEISFQFFWRVPMTGDTSTWRLSSDVADTSVPSGYSMHGDWVNGWKPEILETWIRNCINPRRDCGVGELGEGRRLY